MSYQHQFKSAKNASRDFAKYSSVKKNEILENIAAALEENVEDILKENKKDIVAAGEGPMRDRLLLTKDRIFSMANDVRSVANLEDQVGKIIDEKSRPNGLKISRVRVPLGVVGMIYESRPNVTVDASVLALKSGNAVVLKGGKEAIFSNRVLVKVMKNALKECGASEDVIQFLDTADRMATAEMLEAKGFIDVLIPRGGRGLINFVNENAKIPAIETGASVVHTYVDEETDLENALNIVVNEKVRRVSVCNALDTLLLHRNLAKDFLPKLAKKFSNLHAESLGQKNIPLVKIHADEVSYSVLQKEQYPALFTKTSEDDDTEWLDYIMNIKVVENIEEAIAHIQKHSLGHSESICTKNEEVAKKFLQEVDAACVYLNSSTCFSDGAEFGLGAEIGISTQKMHARGPFALEGLTTYKWVIRGEGQIRE